MPETLALVPLPSPRGLLGLSWGDLKEQGPRGRQWEGCGRSPEKRGWGEEGVMTAAGTPAEPGGAEAVRPGQAAAERAGPALQKAAAGSLERSHLAAGADGDSRTAFRTRDPGQRPGRAGTALCSPTDTPPVRALGAPQPLNPRPLRLRSLPASRPLATRLDGPAPEWGRGSTTNPGDGSPTGHRAAPRGLTDREDRRRWVWAGQSRAQGASG